MKGRWIPLLVAIGLAIAAGHAAAQTGKSAGTEKKPKATAPADKSKTAPAPAKDAKSSPPRSPSEELPPPSTAAATPEEPAAVPAAPTPEEQLKAAERNYHRLLLVSGISIFVLAIFVGFEVISKVPATLHTPLMSGSNAISGITVVGAIIAAAAGWGFSSFLGFFAVILAMVNVVGGFLVTHRMLLMFKRK